jgi:hypothetical protein
MRIRTVLAIGIVSAAACSAPAPTVSVATPSPTVASTPSPLQPSAVPSASASASGLAWAVTCGTVSDFKGNTSSTDGSMVLNSPGRSPLTITLTSAHSTPGGGIGGYVCASLVAGVPYPIFDGLFPSVGFINQGVFPATAALPAPTGFVLPQACAFVVRPVVGTDQTDWSIDCGAANNNNARGTLGPALMQQGWALCASGLATAQWRKDNVMLGVVESTLAPGEYMRLIQFARVISPC